MTSRRRFVAAALAAALLAGCGADEAPRGATAAADKAPKTVRDDQAVETVEATGEVVQARIPLGSNHTCGVVAHEGRVFAVVAGKRQVVAVDAGTAEVVRRYAVPGDPCFAAVLPGALLLDDGGDRLVRLDLESGEVTASARADRGCGTAAVDRDTVWYTTDRTSQRIGRFRASDLRPTGRVEGVGSIGAGPCDLTFGGGALWAGNDDSTVQRIDPATGKVTDTFETGPRPSFLRWHEDGVLLAGSLEYARLQEVDPERGVTTTYMVGGGPVAVDGSTVYTASAFNGGETGEKPPPIVWAVDLAADRVVGRVRVGSDAPPRDASEFVPPPLDGPAFAAGSLWVVNTTDETLYRLDASRLG